MANMTFGVNLIPKENNTYTLGNSDYKWNVFLNQINGNDINQYIKENSVYYGECSTAAATAAKTVSITGFQLITGAVIKIKFTYMNTASSPTLSINSGTAKAIYLNKGNVSPWGDGETVEMIYDGTQWNIIGYDKIEVVML